MRSCALPTHTFVPWEKPEMRTSSEKFFGFVSSSIFRTKRVPYSGRPMEPTVFPLLPMIFARSSGV